jgi:hypothetical protein
MMSKLRVQAVVALILATILVTAGLTTTFGYVAQRQYAVALSAPSSVKCDQKALITAKVTKVKNGAAVANQAVGWSFVARQSSRDRLSRDMSITNRQGIASVKVSFGPKAGKRIVKATVPGVKTQITVRCKGGLG